MENRKTPLVNNFNITKTIMKKILLFALFISLITCKAQIYPLNTFFEDVPNYSYIKDLDNLLPQYVGTYKATFQGNEITLFITKEDKMLIDYGSNDKKYYHDVLHIKYIVKKLSTGTILQDTINLIDPKRNKIISIGIALYDNNAIVLNYSGTNCGVGNGSIKLKKPTDNQISWSYYPDDSLLDIKECPLSLDRTVYLPVAKDLIFTKQ